MSKLLKLFLVLNILNLRTLFAVKIIELDKGSLFIGKNNDLQFRPLYGDDIVIDSSSPTYHVLDMIKSESNNIVIAIGVSKFINIDAITLHFIQINLIDITKQVCLLFDNDGIIKNDSCKHAFQIKIIKDVLGEVYLQIGSSRLLFIPSLLNDGYPSIKHLIQEK